MLTVGGAASLPRAIDYPDWDGILKGIVTFQEVRLKIIHLTLVLSAFACACGGDSNNGNDGGGNDSSTGNDGSGGDSSPGNDSSTDSGPKPSKANFGSVSFSETKTGQTTTYTATAAFFATPDGGASTSGSCTGTQAGSCCYTPPSDGGTTGPTPTAVSAGGITIKDGASTIGTMSPSGTTYTPLNSTTTSSLRWNDGDSLNVSAAGDTVHAFNGNVTTVAAFANVSPALSFVPGTTISKSQNFTITWTAGTGSVALVLAQTTGAGVITCSATTDPGTMTVDKSLLANFTGLTGTISLSRSITADASPDNADVSLVSSTATSGATTYAN